MVLYYINKKGNIKKMKEKIIEEIENKLDNEIKILINNFKNLRINVTNQSVFDRIFVDYYGVKMPINQMSSISKVGLHLFVVKPFEKDKNVLKDIYSAISKSNIGFVPVIKEDKIEVTIPSLTEETRKEIAKEAKIYYENSVVAIRNIRHHFLNILKKDDDYSEDFKKRLQNEIQKIIENTEKKVYLLFSEKKENIMTI